jgi:hypothetical protein
MGLIMGIIMHTMLVSGAVNSQVDLDLLTNKLDQQMIENSKLGYYFDGVYVTNSYQNANGENIVSIQTVMIDNGTGPSSYYQHFTTATVYAPINDDDEIQAANDQFSNKIGLLVDDGYNSPISYNSFESYESSETRSTGLFFQLLSKAYINESSIISERNANIS